MSRQPSGGGQANAGDEQLRKQTHKQSGSVRKGKMEKTELDNRVGREWDPLKRELGE